MRIITKKHTSIMLMLVFFRSMMRGVLLPSVDGVAGGVIGNLGAVGFLTVCVRERQR